MLAGKDKDLQAKALDAANGGGGARPTGPSAPGGFSASASIGGMNMSVNRPGVPPPPPPPMGMVPPPPPPPGGPVPPPPPPPPPVF